ncbi:hypothetical protein IE077_000135 [Cardiosporidium cionae]|uniref:Ubiquinol-cytochrome c chaperone domain-containing protein n=1 Tax=Cardiosporidium cionae TaxID=476202 RepID=A0ABQ7JDF3_9APIC|nr:hypothetical protein IE077_000135 [Cardiosporidium cionae]|eukprot:KAF8821940.1 hypothetical protein IE077_000135 [Cardiosporidium cionae]
MRSLHHAAAFSYLRRIPLTLSHQRTVESRHLPWRLVVRLRSDESLRNRQEYSEYSKRSANSGQDVGKLRYYHIMAMNDNRWHLDQSDVQKCISSVPPQVGIVGKVQTILERYKILNPCKEALDLLAIAHSQHYNTTLFSTLLLDVEDTDHVMFFFLIHVWLLHRKLVDLDKVAFNATFWEKVWDYYRRFLLQEQVKEGMFSTHLREMQQYSIGFCLGLDEAFDSLTDYWVGSLRCVLFDHIYKQKNVPFEDPHIDELVAYVLRMFQFLKLIPADVFLKGIFNWPEWKSKNLESN